MHIPSPHASEAEMLKVTLDYSSSLVDSWGAWNSLVASDPTQTLNHLGRAPLEGAPGRWSSGLLLECFQGWDTHCLSG